MQPNQNSSTQGGLDPSGTAIADASHVQAGYGGVDGGMYYTLNGYPAHHGYFIGGKKEDFFFNENNIFKGLEVIQMFRFWLEKFILFS